jgi:plasmid replication initiation protein
MQFQSTGFYVVKIEEFRELLDVPKSYRMSDIDKQVLNLSIKELSEYFKDLTVKKIKARKGNKIDRLEFTFSGLKTDLPKVPLHDWTK